MNSGRDGSSKEHVTQRLGVTQADGRGLWTVPPYRTVHYHRYCRILPLLENITRI